MADYSVILSTSSRKDLEKLDAQLVQRIFTKITNLAAQPRPSGCRKLQGIADSWRIRVGDYRVIDTINDRARTVDVAAVRHRRDAYL